MVELKGITKIYKTGSVQTAALKGVDLSVKKGEMIGLMGRSGCGKSTLLQILAGVTEKTSGIYKFADVDVPSNPTKLASFRRQNIGFILQNFALINDRTAYENIALPMKRIEKEKIKLCARMLGLSDLLERYPYELSGGECQRVAIARAIIMSPPLLLADEPTGALDEETGQVILKILHALNRQGMTIIIATHDDDIASGCHRIIRMNDGKVISNGKTAP